MTQLGLCTFTRTQNIGNKLARAVLSDHVLFRECMFYLREDLHSRKYRAPTNPNEKTFSCICTTFHITKIWDLGDFSIKPSHEVRFPSAKKSLISFINNPAWINDEGFIHPLLFGEVLSCLISFITLLPVKSPRDSVSLSRENIDSISSGCIDDVALTLPFIWAGTGAHNSKLTIEKEDKFIEELKELILLLNNVEENIYSFSLEVIRLIHLSILVRRDDFGLAYLLLVSAIESVAQKAIKRDSVKELHPKEREWAKIAKNEGAFNDEFKELLSLYKDARGKNQYLSKRYTKFIMDFCPPHDWEDIVDSRYKDSDREWNDFMQGSKHPSLMQTEEIEEILNKAYNYRSRFVHSATQPPHQSPIASSNKFFEIIRSYKNGLDESQISPTYELMLAIAKRSIMEWLKTKSIK